MIALWKSNANAVLLRPPRIDDGVSSKTRSTIASLQSSFRRKPESQLPFGASHEAVRVTSNLIQRVWRHKNNGFEELTKRTEFRSRQVRSPRDHARRHREGESFQEWKRAWKTEWVKNSIPECTT